MLNQDILILLMYGFIAGVAFVAIILAVLEFYIYKKYHVNKDKSRNSVMFIRR